MSANRTMTQHTVQLFEASRTGDRESVSALLDYDNADINWHCKQAVSETESGEVRTFHFFLTERSDTAHHRDRAWTH